MNILVTGAKGMVGTALVNNVKNIRDNKNRTRPDIHIDEIYEYDIDSTEDELDEYTYTTNGDVKVSKCNFEYLEDDKLDIEKEI